MSQATAVSTSEFDQQVLGSEVPVLVDFWAPWCGPCRRIAPELDAVAQELDGKVKIVKVNVDEDSELATRYGVQGIPNLIVFKGGAVVDRIVGLVPRQTIKETLQRHIG